MDKKYKMDKIKYKQKPYFKEVMMIKSKVESAVKSIWCWDEIGRFELEGKLCIAVAVYVAVRPFHATPLLSWTSSRALIPCGAWGSR